MRISFKGREPPISTSFKSFSDITSTSLSLWISKTSIYLGLQSQNWNCGKQHNVLTMLKRMPLLTTNSWLRSESRSVLFSIQLSRLLLLWEFTPYISPSSVFLDEIFEKCSAQVSLPLILLSIIHSLSSQHCTPS